MIEQYLRDQQAPMAMRGVLLAAHDRHPVLLRPSLKAADGPLEPILLGNLPIEDVTARIVEILPLRSTTQLPAEEEVLDVSLRDQLGQDSNVRPLDETRVGPGANVDQHLDPVLDQEATEVSGVVVRMADREDP